MHELKYTFTAPLWVYQGKGAWHFVTLPKTAADEIRFFNSHANGFVPIATVATVGITTWKTSVFPDSKSGSYLLAIKKAVRKTENLREGEMMKLDLRIPVHG